MSFEDKLIAASGLKQSKLMRPARVASEKPDTGVKILNKSAYFVIRDCADVTQKYLALLCYGSFSDPVMQLKGKFTNSDIKDLVARSRTAGNSHVRQLLCAIVADVNKCECAPVSEQQEEDTLDTFDYESIEQQQDDIYGDYDYPDDDINITSDTSSAEPQAITVDLTGDTSLADRLIQAFKA